MGNFIKRIETGLVIGCVLAIALCMYFTFASSETQPKIVGVAAFIFGISLMAWPWIANRLKKEQ